MTSDPDMELMLRCRRGDTAAFQTLFTRYKAKIVNYCYRFCGEGPLAEDLAQEVFLRMYRAAPKYRPRARFSTWLFTIATNVCLNETRKQKKYRGTVSVDAPVEAGGGGLLQEIKDSRPGADEALMVRDRQAAIQDALAALPDKQRAALLLRIHQGFSYKEIAGQLKSTENTVKTLIRRGRQRMTEMLENE